MRLKSTIYESTLSTADAVPLPQWGRLRYEDAAFLDTTPSPRGKAKRRRLRRQKKESQPRLAALGSPFQGKGLAWTHPPSIGRRCPEGAKVGWGWRCEKSEEDRLKYAVCESTLSTADAVPLPQWGRQRYEDTAFLDTKPSPRGEGKEEAASPPKKEANAASLRSAAPSKGRGSRGRSLLPMEGGAPKGRRLDGDGGMKESEGDRLKCVVNESTLSTAGAVPLPQWGRLRYENTVILEIKPFPRGEGKEEAALPQKKEANPASLRSAAPSKRRGSRGHSLLPIEGGAPKGRIKIKCSAVLCKSIYESSIIKQMIWTGWGLVTSSGVTPLQNR